MAVAHPETLSNICLVYLHQTRIRIQIIYSITLVAIIATIGSLPLIYATISVRGQGFIQSEIEKSDVLAPTNGRLLRVNLTDNKRVKKGDVLLIIDSFLLLKQIEIVGTQIWSLEQQLKDIKIIVNTINDSLMLEKHVLTLNTELYISSWHQYRLQFKSAINIKQRAEHRYQQQKTLYNKNITSLAELEQYKFDYEQALSAQQVLNHKYINQLQTEALHYNSEAQRLKSEELRLKDLENQYVLKALVTGSLQNLVGVREGSYVVINQKIGEISPDSTLFAYCYLTSSAIGLIKKNQRVHLQIDAFSYSQWGSLNATVVDISDDIVLRNQAPYFKIKCRLDKTYLKLKNGYKGHIKKGMTFNAQFTIGRRNLYQLLSDQVTDWINL